MTEHSRVGKKKTAPMINGAAVLGDRRDFKVFATKINKRSRKDQDILQIILVFLDQSTNFYASNNLAKKPNCPALGFRRKRRDRLPSCRVPLSAM
jgi:hypothetical protein